MPREPIILLLVCALAASGCLNLGGSGTGLPDAPTLGSLRVGNATAALDESLSWTGRVLSTNQEHPAGAECLVLGVCPAVDACSGSNCDRILLGVDLAEGWNASTMRLAVRIQWDTRDQDYGTVEEYLGLARLHMDLSIRDTEGKLVADGVESGHYASVAIMAVRSATLEIRVHALWGTGGYRGSVQIEPPLVPSTGEKVDLLPDVVLLPPAHLRVEHPLVREVGPALVAAGDRGCGPDETLEHAALRCLRFAGAVGNAGMGALEFRLSQDDALASLALPEGQWRQRVYASDGSFHDAPGVPAHFHATHGHFHSLGVTVATVHAYDMDTATRGEEVARGQKTGYCFIDGGLLQLNASGAPAPAYFGWGCCYLWGFCELDLLAEGEFFMGVGPGWFDVYPWWRADQYVDITNVPDGVYELVFVGNPDGTILETDAGNNEASLVFRLTGDQVEELSWTGPYPPYVVAS